MCCGGSFTGCTFNASNPKGIELDYTSKSEIKDSLVKAGILNKSGSKFDQSLFERLCPLPKKINDVRGIKKISVVPLD